jgi:hypothetical protein
MEFERKSEFRLAAVTNAKTNAMIMQLHMQYAVGKCCSRVCRIRASTRNVIPRVY